MHLKVRFKTYIKMHKKGTPEDGLKGAPQIALELQMFMQLSMYKSVQNDSVKGKIEEAFYSELEDASKISVKGTLKTTQKVDDPLVSAIGSAP